MTRELREIDAGLSPGLGGVELLRQRAVERRIVVQELWQFLAKRLVVGRHHDPGNAAVDRREDAGAVAHGLGRRGGTAGRLAIFQEVVEIKRRLIRRQIPRQAERIRHHLAERAAGQVVVIADVRIGGQVALPVVRQRTVLSIWRLVREVIRVVVFSVASIRLQSEVDTRTTQILALNFRIGTVGQIVRSQAGSSGVVGSRQNPVADVRRAVHRGMPQVDVQRRKRQAA